MIKKLTIQLLCIVMPFSALADEQVIRCAIATKIEVDDERGTRQLDPEGAHDQFKLLYNDGELIHVEKMPRLSRCKGGPTVSISANLVEVSCESTLFKDYFSYFVLNRYSGEYRSDSVSNDGKLVSLGTCKLAKPQF